MNWLLPEYLADALPPEAARIERLRRRILDYFTRRGYEFVMPPLLEYLESLLTGTGHDLYLRTCKLSDQLSGRTLGIRADITPQAARIDAHLLNRAGITRLCYCGSVLHALPASLTASREPIQIGAELYGYAGIAADREMLRLLAAALQTCEIHDFRLSLSHIGIFRALTEAAGASQETEETLFTLLQNKNAPDLAEFCAALPTPYGEAFTLLPSLYGDARTVEAAREKLPPLPRIHSALETLSSLLTVCGERPPEIDLSDLRGYHYHSGVMFAAYVPEYPAAIALGGRYDGAGKSFGRARPATGFSLDLRELARFSKADEPEGAILAPYLPEDAELAECIDTLRAAGEIVLERLPDESGVDPRCDRQLTRKEEGWSVTALTV
ncbi:MAG: ATP phosphoribosyltransferase regulatory subunit [Zoogloeaceae bacterium]|jgi:ATP phosphoribosyltransferase regulatory subunit|nr:ATP phosphoribosyltransferase regulatory subunit [Zoogloeaceae bacterium]